MSRIWRILQIKEGVIHWDGRPRWITPSEICRILHILQKPNWNVFKLSKDKLNELLFFCSPKITQPCPQVFSVNSSIICRGLLFWHHFDIICSIIYSWLHFYVIGQQQLVMVNYACSFNQSETGKYFERTIMKTIWAQRDLLMQGKGVHFFSKQKFNTTKHLQFSSHKIISLTFCIE